MLPSPPACFGVNPHGSVPWTSVGGVVSRVSGQTSAMPLSRTSRPPQRRLDLALGMQGAWDERPGSGVPIVSLDVKGQSVTTTDSAKPRGHTSDGGVIVGRSDAERSLVLFEDPQCPYCKQFEELNGETVNASASAGKLRVEYRMRCFLGQESVRADNALALAAEAGRFDDLRQALFAAQPPEGSGGFTTEDLIDLGRKVRLTDPDFVWGIRQGRYEDWVLRREARYQQEDPQGTPAAWLDGQPLDSRVLFDPTQFARRFHD